MKTDIFKMIYHTRKGNILAPRLALNISVSVENNFI